MQTTIPHRITEIPARSLTVPTCLCGARLRTGQAVCRKCRARERWHRRHQVHADNRRRTDAHRATALLLAGAR